MHPYLIQPRDVLFFRDARPMGGSSVGAGADWPLPSVLHSALLSAFHERWPEGTEWESAHRHLADREKKKFRAGPTTHMRFGGLRTLGPFPCRGNDVFLPTPADLVPDGLLQPVATAGVNNLPTPLRYAVASSAPPGKDRTGAWLPLSEFARYLRDNTHAVNTERSEQLFVAEPRPGVGIDPQTHANREALFYQAEYLRLQPGVELAVWVSADARKYDSHTGVDLLEQWFAGDPRQFLILGGQRGLATVEPCRKGFGKTDDLAEQLPPPATDTARIKWVLLTPALFDNGWRPDWVDEEGNVLLRELPDRTRFASRREWRQAAAEAPGIRARLVAARVQEALPVSGWKLARDGDHAAGEPKPTRLLAPAGSVYYFECDDPDQASRLVTQLHLQVKSQRLGEKGFGFGVCGTWGLLDV